MAGKTPELDRATVEANLAAVDYAIFEALPDEGTSLGYHPLFKSARSVAAELNKALPDGVPPVTTGYVSGRMRTMHAVQLIVPMRTLAGSIEGWQRTARAKYLAEMHEQNVQVSQMPEQQDGGVDVGE